MPRRQRTALHVKPTAINRTQRCVEPQAGFAIFGIFPGLERAQDLRGEGFVNFVVIKILQGQAVARQQAWHGIDRSHQQALGTVDEIHRRRLAVAQISEDRQAARFGPFLTSQQHHRSAIGERRRVTRRQRALGAFLEGRFQRGEFFQGQVRAQIVVAGQAEERRHQIVVPAFAVGSGEFVVAFEGQLILFFAGNIPGLRHQLTVLAHGQASTWLAVAREFGNQMLGAQLQKGFQFVAGALGAVGL